MQGTFALLHRTFSIDEICNSTWYITMGAITVTPTNSTEIFASTCLMKLSIPSEPSALMYTKLGLLTSINYSLCYKLCYHVLQF